MVDEQSSIKIQQALDNDSEVITTNLSCNTSSTVINEMTQVLVDTIQLMTELEREDKEVTDHQMKQKVRGGANILMVGDQVEANYALEGMFYPAVIEDVVSVTTGSIEVKEYVVRYEDDGSCETLSSQNVRAIIPPTATQTSLGGPLSDEEAFDSGDNESDDTILMKQYELQFALAQIKEQVNDSAAASTLYEIAADGAVADGKMQSATVWSLKAAELQSM